MSLKVRLPLAILCTYFVISSYGFYVTKEEKTYDEELRRLLNCLLDKKECQGKSSVRQTGLPSSSSVYLNGVVYTVDVKRQPDNWHLNPKQALVIEDDKIVFVGSDEEAKTYIIDEISEVYDLNGYTVLPGIHDIHMHPLEAMTPVGNACQLPNLKRPDDKSILEELSKCSQSDSVTGWILGGGYSITPMLKYAREGNSPKHFLDIFIPNKPAAMLEETSHSAWVNSKALELANITDKTEERPGGVIMREPNSNVPNGILFENEAVKIFELAMDPTGKKQVQDLNYNGLLDALNELSAYGITSVCDARLFWKIKHHHVWEKACNEGTLTARAILGLWAYPNMEDDHQINELKRLYWDRNTNCDLRKSQIKVYMDGIVESTTAAMDDEYLLNLSLPIISIRNVGMNYFDKARLEKYLTELQDLGGGEGFDFHIHAIGDRGIRDALDAIEGAQSTSLTRLPRHRLTHLEILHKADIDRFEELDVIADFQVAGDFTLPSEHEELAKIIGKEKADFSIPVKSVVDTGAVTTFSSDWDVSELNPFKGIQHATQRGEQSVSVKTAVEMYTVNPAFAMRQEETVGALRAGMDADFIVIDQDILNIRNDKISETSVLETVFKGKRIYPKYPGESVLQNYYYWWEY